MTDHPRLSLLIAGMCRVRHCHKNGKGRSQIA